MPNDVKLQEGHPLDENLRPIKVDDESTPIEVSKEETKNNKAVPFMFFRVIILIIYVAIGGTQLIMLYS